MPELYKPNPAPEVRTITIVNRTEDVAKRATKIAQDQLREEQHKRVGFSPKKWMRKIGLHFGEEFYRQRGIKRAREAILQTNNVFVEVDTVHDEIKNQSKHRFEHRGAGLAKIEQVRLPDEIHDKHFQQVHEAKGSLKQLLVDEIIRPVVDGRVLSEDTVQRKLRTFVRNHSKDRNSSVAKQITTLFGKDATQYGRIAELFATDLLEVGTAIKADLQAHRYAIDQIQDHVAIQLANTSWAAATGEHRTVADRAVTAVQKRPWARAVLNETSVGVIASVASFVVMRGSGRALSALSIGAGGGAIIGAAGRNRNLKLDMSSHRSDAEYAETWTEDAKNRAKLEKYRYTEVASVSEMLQKDEQRSTAGNDSRSLRTLLALPHSPENNAALATRVAEMQERLRFSASEQSGFITYANATSVEQGRLELIKGIAEGKRKLVGSFVIQGKEVHDAVDETDRMIRRNAKEWEERFAKDRKEKERKFRLYRLRSSLAYGAIGGAIGFVSGLLTQEAIAGVTRLSGEHVSPTLLEKPFTDTNKTITTTSGYTTERVHIPVSGEHGIWNLHATQTDHREWYGYDTPGSNNNELKLHTVKKGDGIDLIMQNMGVSSESELKPPHLSVPGVQEQGEAAFAFSMPNQENSSVIVMADHLGRLHLNPHDTNPMHTVSLANGEKMPVGQFSQIVLNPSAYDALPNGDIATEANHLRSAFNLGGPHGNSIGEISAGRVVERSGGEHVWQSFATIFGTGKTPASITQEIHIPTIIHEAPVMGKEVPAIPIVVTPRRALEPESERTV